MTTANAASTHQRTRSNHPANKPNFSLILSIFMSSIIEFIVIRLMSCHLSDYYHISGIQKDVNNEHCFKMFKKRGENLNLEILSSNLPEAFTCSPNRTLIFPICVSIRLSQI